MRLNSVFSQYICFFIAILISLASVQISNAQEISRPLTFGGPRFVVDDFEAYLNSDGKLLVVSGKVDNLTNKQIRGYIVVYLKNSAHDVLNAVDLKLKNGGKIARKKSCAFETKINIESYSQLANVSIEFVEQK